MAQDLAVSFFVTYTRASHFLWSPLCLSFPSTKLNHLSPAARAHARPAGNPSQRQGRTGLDECIQELSWGPANLLNSSRVRSQVSTQRAHCNSNSQPTVVKKSWTNPTAPTCHDNPRHCTRRFARRDSERSGAMPGHATPCRQYLS